MQGQASTIAVQYDDPDRLTGYWPRRSARVALDAEISLRRPGQASYRVRVLNASRHGCRVEFIERPRLEEQVWVRFEGLEALEALVCWTEGFIAGLEFERPIHPAVFDRIVAKLK